MNNTITIFISPRSKIFIISAYKALPWTLKTVAPFVTEHPRKIRCNGGNGQGKMTVWTKGNTHVHLYWILAVGSIGSYSPL